MAVLTEYAKKHVGYMEEIAECISLENLLSSNFEPVLPVGPLSPEGLYVTNAKQHTITIGRTGCGKTVSSIAPSLALFAASKTKPNVICVDAKPTTRDMTLDVYANNGYKVVNIDLRSTANGDDSWNPLGDATKSLRQGDYRSYERAIGVVLDSLGETITDKNDKYWEQSMRTLVKSTFEGLISNNTAEEISLYDILKIVNGGKNSILNLAHSDTADNTGWKKSIINIANLPSDSTLPCVLNVTHAALQAFGWTSVIKASSSSSLNIQDLSKDTPIAIFLVCPEEITNVHVYSILLINRIIQEIITAAETSGHIRETHMVIDEFGLLPKCDISKEIAASRSRGLFFHLSFQSLSQLVSGAYTPAEAKVLVQQAGALWLMSCNDDDIVEQESKICPAITYNLISSLDTGVALVHEYGKPVFRAELSPYSTYTNYELFKAKKTDETLTNNKSDKREDACEISQAKDTTNKAENNGADDLADLHGFPEGNYKPFLASVCRFNEQLEFLLNLVLSGKNSVAQVSPEIKKTLNVLIDYLTQYTKAFGTSFIYAKNGELFINEETIAVAEIISSFLENIEDPKYAKAAKGFGSFRKGLYNTIYSKRKLLMICWYQTTQTNKFQELAAISVNEAKNMAKSSDENKRNLGKQRIQLEAAVHSFRFCSQKAAEALADQDLH